MPWKRFKPSSKIFTDQSKAVILLWIFNVFSFFCLLCLCVLLFMCLVVTCWERVDLLAFVCGVWIWCCQKCRTVVSRTCQLKWKPFLDALQSSWYSFDASGLSWFKEIGDISLIKCCQMKKLTPISKIRKWPSLFYLHGYLEPRTIWPRGLVGLQNQRTWIDSWLRTHFKCAFSFFFNILMLNGFRY